jgi:hypothetical protein
MFDKMSGKMSGSRVEVSGTAPGAGLGLKLPGKPDEEELL